MQGDVPAEVRLTDLLGPLPEETELHWDSNEGGITMGYTAEDMEAERERCYALGVAAERERWLPSLRRLADAAKNVTGPTFAPWIDELDAAYREAKAKIEKA